MCAYKIWSIYICRVTICIMVLCLKGWGMIQQAPPERVTELSIRSVIVAATIILDYYIRHYLAVNHIKKTCTEIDKIAELYKILIIRY